MTLLKPVVESYLRDSCKSLMWVALVYTAVIAAIVLVVGVISINYYDNTGVIMIGGAEVVFVLTMLIVCISSFKGNIHFFIQHGISRRTAFLGFVLHLPIAGVVYAVTALFLTGLISWLPGTSLEAFLFGAIYYEWLGAMGTLPSFLIHFIWTWALLFTVGAAGYFFAALFYSLNTIGKILLPVVIIVIIPMINRLTGGLIVQFKDWLSWMFRGGDAMNPLNDIGFFLVLSAIVLGFSWLFVRRYKLEK